MGTRERHGLVFHSLVSPSRDSKSLISGSARRSAELTKQKCSESGSWCWAFTRWTRCSSGPWWLCCFLTHFSKRGFPRPDARADLALFHSVPHSSYELRGKPGFDFTLYPHPSPHTSPTEGGSEPGACSLCPITASSPSGPRLMLQRRGRGLLCCARLGHMCPLECHDYPSFPVVALEAPTTVFRLFPLLRASRM